MISKLSFGKKICAMLLSGLILIGSVPVAMATDESLPDDDPVQASEATPDEAEESAQGSSSGGSQYADSNMRYNDGAVCYYLAAADRLYFTGNSLSFIRVETNPGEELYESIEKDLNDPDVGDANFSVTLEYYPQSGKQTLNHKPDTELEASNGVLSAKLNFTDALYPNGLPTGTYNIVIGYDGGNGEETLYTHDFAVVNEDSLAVKNICLDGTSVAESPEWSKSDKVKITFETDSDIPAGATVNGYTAANEGGVYSYTADKTGDYEIKVQDLLGTTGTETVTVKIDTKAPVASDPEFFLEDGSELGDDAWSSKPLTVKVKLTDAESAVDTDSITLDGKKVPAEDIESDKDDVTVSFKAEKAQGYTLEFADKAGNSGKAVIEKKDIRIDSDAPAAKDFVVSFAKGGDVADKVLRFLTFGLYSNDDIHMTINVDNEEGAPVDENSYKIFDGEKDMAAVGGKTNEFILPAPEDGESVLFDLYVQAADKAGNDSGKISLNEEGIRVKLPDDTVKPLKEAFPELFEVVISKIVPIFENNEVKLDFEQSAGSPEKFCVHGNGTVSVKVKESVTGIADITATVNGEPVELECKEDTVDKGTSRVTEMTASFKMEEPEEKEYTVVFTAKSNSGMPDSITRTFYVYNTAPQLGEDGFEYSNVKDGKQNWTPGTVNVSFSLVDNVEISSVRAYNKTGNPEPSEADYIAVSESGGRYSFTAEEYGLYAVVAKDALTNSAEYETDAVLIDKEAPEIADGSIAYKVGKESFDNQSWVNQDVTVSFDAKDLPEGDGASGIKYTYINGKKHQSTAEDGSTYEFTVSDYGIQKITLQDNANNRGRYEIGPVLIDKLPPVIEKVEFSSANNDKAYGIYDKNAVIMTVTVNNVHNSDGKGSELKALEIIEGDTVLSGEPQKVEGEQTRYAVSYQITAGDNPRDFVFRAEDMAGNTVSKNIRDESVSVVIGNDVITEHKDIAEIVVTEAKPEIGKDGIQISFDRRYPKNETEESGVFYSGKGTFKASFADNLAGIDSYATYFVKSEDLKYDKKGNIIFDGLKNVEGSTAETVNGVSDKKKVTSVDIKLETPEKDKLESGMYTAIFKAFNLSGNPIVKSVEVAVDNSTPTLTGIDIATKGSGSYFTTKNGVYSSKDLEVTVNFDDGACSSGIKSIQMFNGDKELQGEDGTFVLEGDKMYQLFAVITDNFDDTEGRQDIKKFPVKIDGKDFINDKDHFEIVVNTSADTNKLSEIKYDFGYKQKYANTDNWIVSTSHDNPNGFIYATATNDLSGVKEFTASVQKASGEDTGVRVTEEEQSKDDFNKFVDRELKIDASGLASGTYELTYKVVDYAGVEKEFKDTFHVDKTRPVLYRITYEKNSSAIDKFIGFLTFGLYSNDTVNATVIVYDKDPSCEIRQSGITMSSENGKRVSGIGNFTELSGDEIPDDIKDARVYKATFKIEPGDSAADSNYSDLRVSVNDQFNNTTEGSFNQFENYLGAVPFTQYVKNGEFEIVTTKFAPVIQNFAANEKPGTFAYADNGDNIPSKSGRYFSAAPDVSFTVTDQIAKLNTVKVTIEDESGNTSDITSSCHFTDIAGISLDNVGTIGDNGKEFTNFDIPEGEKIAAIIVNIDTAKLGDASLAEGRNTITVYAKNNSGNKSDSSFVVVLDTAKPVVQEFEFNPSSDYTMDANSESYKVPAENGNYYYVFKDSATVTVGVTDDVTVKGSGISYVHLYLQPSGSSSMTDADIESQNEDKTSTTFRIPADFKGQLYAYAVDNVENNRSEEDTYTPDSVITETEYQHKSNSGAEIESLTAVNGKDNSGKELYRNSVELQFDVHSNFAGIYSVEYTVESPYHSDTPGGKALVGRDGAISEDDGWQTISTDRNLVTAMRKRITVGNNSNDIKVKLTVTDRAHYSTETEYTFSIDKTAPTIKVEWNTNNGNTISGESVKYYKENRIATITVYERNFDPKDFEFSKLTVATDLGPAPQSIAAGSGWSTGYAMNESDPDNTAHVATLTFDSDGTYDFGLDYADLAGNAAETYKDDRFTVDKTAPIIKISFEPSQSKAGGKYFNETRVATITINEHNFYAPNAKLTVKAGGPENPPTPTETSWNSAGNNDNTSTITFDRDGTYSFTVTFTDKAGNDSPQNGTSDAAAAEFVIDKTIEAPKFSGVKDFEAYDGQIAPSITFFDHNLAESSCTYTMNRVDINSNSALVDNLAFSDDKGNPTKTVTYGNFPTVPDNDGIYIVKATTVDLAGNRSEEAAVVFSVNRFGSTFMYTDDVTKNVMDTYYVNISPKIAISEINVNAVTDSTIRVNKDDSVTTLEKGTNYEVNQSGDSRSWYQYDYSIFDSNFVDEGKYNITLTSTDRFKHTVSNITAYGGDEEINASPRTCPVSFVLDKTPPIVTISGIEKNEYYEESAKDVVINCSDANITSEFLKVQFDGEDVDYTIASEIAGNIEIKLELEADNGDIDRDFKVTVSDKAGNYNVPEEGGEITGFRLSTSWISRLLHYNLPIVIAGGCVLLAGIALAVFLIIRKRSK